MLYINKGERSRLPRQYRSANNLCAIIYDQLTEIFTEKYYKPLVTTDIPVDEEKQTLREEFEKGEIDAIDWLAANGLNKEFNDLLTKHIVLSVVSDFVNFMFESMNCAKNGKFSVAYALLRKPMTDELLLLEQILFDREDFIARFYHQGEPIHYDPSSPKLDKRKIIENAINKLKPHGFFIKELIYKIRYDKAYEHGINGISNHALHIVTQDKNYKTLNQNLNFIFSVEEDFEEYRQHYYYFVPYLLLYAVSIVDEIIFQFLPGEDLLNLKAVKAFKRFVGYVLWTERRTNAKPKKSNNDLMQTLGQVLTLICKNCGEKKKLERQDYELFFETELVICEKCLTNILSSKESVEPIREFMSIIK